MYREGPEGTPYHTLLAEGHVDGALDICKLNFIYIFLRPRYSSREA